MRLVVLLLAVACAAAQESAVHLRFGTVGGRTEFHIGESIPIALDFEVKGPQSFQISTDDRLRHLRPQGHDEFSATPVDGWVDPLGDLQWTIDGSVPSTGSWGSARLDAVHPLHIERDLNEFIVFHKPGRYVVHTTSDRVSGVGKRLDTNEIALTILPRDEAWTTRQFASAKAALEAPKPPQEHQVDAVRTLRYLETEPSARYLVSIYGRSRGPDQEVEYALLASPFREAIVDEFQRQMANPDLTLTQSYVIPFDQIKARILERQLGHALAQEDWKKLGDDTDKRVLEAANGKNAEAKAGTYYYLYKVGSGSLRGSPEVLRRLIALLPSAPPWAVSQLLGMDWEAISGSKTQILPFLKDAVTRSWPRFTPDIAGLALLRLEEIDAQVARDAALKELLSGETRIGDPALLEIAVPASPLLDQALLEQYRQGKPAEARIAKFASPDIKDDLWRAWSAKPTCAGPLFAYFFRVDPSRAAERLAELRKAGGNACTGLQFPGLERQLMSPGLEQQLIADATSGNPNIQGAAFRILSIGGSRAALPVMLDAIDKGSSQKQDLIVSVLNARRWIPMDADFVRLAKNCTGTIMCPEIERRRREFQPPYSLRILDMNGHRDVWLSNRQVDSPTDLDTILDQFPAGAAFRWEPLGRPMSSSEREMHDKVSALVDKHGMTLEN